MEKDEQMRIGVVSDTHGDLHALRQVLDQAGEVDLWLHAGDYSQDAPYIEEKTGIPVYAVCGNCDSYTDRAPAELVTKQLGVTLAMTHGHRYVRYNDWSRLFYFGEEKQADVVIFGHIHVPVCVEEDGILLVNPGSPSRPRNGVPSFGILTLEKGKKPKFEVIEVREYANMSREELLEEICRLRINEERLKKGYQVKEVNGKKLFIRLGKPNTK
jgi:uncharacterized protein